MTSIIDRIGALAGTELSKAVDLAHRTFQDRHEEHRHFGLAMVETVAEVARNHPNLVGVGVGLLVEQMLSQEKRRHDAHQAALRQAEADRVANPEAAVEAVEAGAVVDGSYEGFGADQPLNAADRHGPVFHFPTPNVPMHRLRAGHTAWEVFAALVVLKLAATGARMFRHKAQHEVWFAPAARIRLFSGSLATYYAVKAITSPKVSAWRNAAVLFFGTDAIKPLLKTPRRRRELARLDPARSDQGDRFNPSSDVASPDYTGRGDPGRIADR